MDLNTSIKPNLSIDHLTDPADWPLSPPSKVQLQKCEKCSYEFFSPFNHRRHTRTHRRISHVDKEDLILKRKNVAAFWDKLNQNEAQQIFVSARKYDLEDLSGEVVVSYLFAFKKQNNQMNHPSAYIKAGQDLLDMLKNKQKVFPIFSEQILSILDEASEKTFLCSQGDVSKNGLEEKNLVASLGFIVEQTLIKAWMADKDAQALRNQQELVKEEEVAQMKREKNVAKKKKKKEKSRQKGLKERKGGSTQLTLNEENKSIDGENPSPEIIEEDNSPTASSTSINSSGLETRLLEHLEMEVNNQVQNVDMRDHDVGGKGGYLLKSKNILSIHLTSKNIVSESFDREKVQQSGCDLAFHGKEGEQRSNFPFSSQVKVEDQGGCCHAFGQDQGIVESYKHIPLRPYREPMRVGYHDSYQKRGWIPDPRFQEGIQQNSFRALQKPLTGTSYISDIELGSNSVLGFYRGKPTSLRGTTPFSTTQQWAKKTQISTIDDHVNKDSREFESSHKHNIFRSKINVKDLVAEHTILAREMDVNTIGNITKVEKGEFKNFKKKESLLLSVPSVAKVVAGTSSISTTSFVFNVNMEDWPPLSNSNATYNPKNTKIYSLTSNQCEVNSRPMNKLNVDRRGDHQFGLESMVEGSTVTTIPPVRSLVDETTTRLVTAGLQNGIMIGSVSVPLSNYVHPSKPRPIKIGTRINTLLPMHQSYTTILDAPLVQYTQDQMASIASLKQKTHDEFNCLEIKDSSNLQVMDSYEGPIHYKTSSLRSTPCISLNARHVRGPTYPLGDPREREILSKQPSWLNGPICHIPQKVWRPIRLTGDKANHNLSFGTRIENSPIKAIEKVAAKFVYNKESINASLSQNENTQIQNMNINRDEQCPTSAIDSQVQVGNQNCILNVKNKKGNSPQNITKCGESLVILDGKHIQNCQEISQVAFVAKLDSDDTCQPLKNNTIELNTSHIFHGKKDNVEKMDDKAHVEIVQSHSTWIIEAIKLHLSRWQSGLKDPETVVGSCKEVHSKLQTSKWIDFMDNLPSIVTRLSFQKEDVNNQNLKTSKNTNQIETKSCRNLLDDHQSINAQNNKQKRSGPGSQAILYGEELSSTYESESLSDVGSTLIDHITVSQNYGKGNNEGQIGSRSGSNFSSMNNNSQTNKRDWISTVNTTVERPQEKQYTLKEGCHKEKRSC